MNRGHLRMIEQSGIGHRRTEGFGQVAIDDRVLTSAVASHVASHLSAAAATLLDAPTSEDLERASGFAFSGILAMAAVRAAIRQAVENVVIDAARLEFALPVRGARRGQLATLRELTGRVREWPDRRVILSWIAHLDSSRRGVRKLPPALSERVKLLLSAECVVWEQLDVDPRDLTVTRLQGAGFRSSLWGEAFRALVTECLRRAMRRMQ